MELTEFFKGYADIEQSPIVICDLSCRILYLNPYAENMYSAYGGKALLGKLLNSYMDEETKSKVDMVIEWFKESPENNRVFGFHDKSLHTDAYIIALRDESGKLIGFSSRHEYRIIWTDPPYQLD